MAGKVKYHNLSQLEKKKYLGDFYSMVALLKSRDEVKNFFKDLLTLSEVVMISRRIQVAEMLLEGYNYDKIRKRLKIGLTTISQVEKWLFDGFGGYKKTIGKFQEKNKAKSDFDQFGEIPFSREWTRKKYPLHYLLSNLLNKK